MPFHRTYVPKMVLAWSKSGVFGLPDLKRSPLRFLTQAQLKGSWSRPVGTGQEPGPHSWKTTEITVTLMTYDVIYNIASEVSVFSSNAFTYCGLQLLRKRKTTATATKSKWPKPSGTGRPDQVNPLLSLATDLRYLSISVSPGESFLILTYNCIVLYFMNVQQLNPSPIDRGYSYF